MTFSCIPRECRIVHMDSDDQTDPAGMSPWDIAIGIMRRLEANLEQLRASSEMSGHPLIQEMADTLRDIRSALGLE